MESGTVQASRRANATSGASARVQSTAHKDIVKARNQGRCEPACFIRIIKSSSILLYRRMGTGPGSLLLDRLRRPLGPRPGHDVFHLFAQRRAVIRDPVFDGPLDAAGMYPL